MTTIETEVRSICDAITVMDRNTIEGWLIIGARINALALLMPTVQSGRGPIEHSVKAACQVIIEQMPGRKYCYRYLEKIAQAARLLTDREKAAYIKSAMPLRDLLEISRKKTPPQERKRVLVETETKGRPLNYYRQIHSSDGSEDRPSQNSVIVPIPKSDDDDNKWDSFKYAMKSIQIQVPRARLEAVLAENWRELKR